MKNNFPDRLEQLLGGRKIHGWGSKIGLTRTVITRLNQGILPGADKLRPIVRTENVSLTWLIEGIGEKYLVNHCYSDADCCELLQAHYDEQWQTYIVIDRFNLAVVLTQPGSYEVDGISYLYTVAEVLTGPINDKTFYLIAEQNTGDNTFFVETSVTTMQALYRGNIGTYGLIHADNALLADARPLSKEATLAFITGNQVAEEGCVYGGGGEVSSDEMAVVEDLRQLNPQNLTHIRAVIHSLADKTDRVVKKD